VRAESDNLDAELSAYLDGELPPERAAAVRAYLEHSPDARRLLAELSAVSDGLRALPQRRAPAGLVETVSTELGERLRVRIRVAHRRKVLWWTSSLSAAALLVLVVLLGRDGWNGRGAGDDRSIPVALRETRGPSHTASAPVADVGRSPAQPPGERTEEVTLALTAREHTMAADEPGQSVPEAAPAPLLVEGPVAARVEASTGRDSPEIPAEFRFTPVEMEQYAALLAMLREWVVAGLATQEVTPASDPQVYVLASPQAASQVAQLLQAATADRAADAPRAKTAPARGATDFAAHKDSAARAGGAAATSQAASRPAAESQPVPAPVRVIIHPPNAGGRPK
jgi:hypothetical protein